MPESAELVVYESRFRRVVRPSQRWRWRLVHANGRNLANGGEGYTDEAECREMAAKVVGGRFSSALS